MFVTIRKGTGDLKQTNTACNPPSQHTKPTGHELQHPTCTTSPSIYSPYFAVQGPKGWSHQCLASQRDWLAWWLTSLAFTESFLSLSATLNTDVEKWDTSDLLYKHITQSFLSHGSHSQIKNPSSTKTILINPCKLWKTLQFSRKKPQKAKGRVCHILSNMNQAGFRSILLQGQPKCFQDLQSKAWPKKPSIHSNSPISVNSRGWSLHQVKPLGWLHQKKRTRNFLVGPTRRPGCPDG